MTLLYILVALVFMGISVAALYLRHIRKMELLQQTRDRDVEKAVDKYLEKTNVKRTQEVNAELAREKTVIAKLFIEKWDGHLPHQSDGSAFPIFL